jgi:hypothetical protein
MAQFVSSYGGRFRDYLVVGNYVSEVSMLPSTQPLCSALICYNVDKMAVFKTKILPVEKWLAVKCVEISGAVEINSGQKCRYTDPFSRFTYVFDQHAVFQDKPVNRTSEMISLAAVAACKSHVTYGGNIAYYDRIKGEPFDQDFIPDEVFSPLIISSTLLVEADVFSFFCDRIIVKAWDGFLYCGGVRTGVFVSGCVYYAVFGDKLLVLDADIPGSFLKRRGLLRKAGCALVDCVDGPFKIFLNSRVGEIFTSLPLVDVSGDDFLDDPELSVGVYVEESVKYYGLSMHDGMLCFDYDSEFYYYPNKPSLAQQSNKEKGGGFRFRVAAKKYARLGPFFFEEKDTIMKYKYVTVDDIWSDLLYLSDSIKDDLSDVVVGDLEYAW